VWVLAVPLPPWTAVRGVMLDVTGALAHLHASGVVHADVKPANILIGPGGRGVLAGFDIVVNSGVRTTEQYLATTRYRVGWTPFTRLYTVS
jgi:serine/threonine protein kinase